MSMPGVPREIAEVHDAVIRISPDMSEEDVLRLREQVLFMQSGIKNLKASLDRALIEWMKANGDMHVGPIRLFVKKAKRTKIRDQAKTFEALVEALGGDVEQIAGCLRAQGIKVTSLKLILDDWENHVDVETIFEVGTQKPKEIVGEETEFSRQLRESVKLQEGASQ